MLINKLFILIIITLVLPKETLLAFNIEDDGSARLRNVIVEVENQLIQSSNQAYASNQLDGVDAWIDDSELKWNNSNIGDFDQQKLSFEIKLKNSEQIHAEQQILNMGQSKVGLKLSILLEKRLKFIYNSLIDYIDQKKRSNLLVNQRKLANSELDMWKLKVNSDSFRAEKLQQADLSLDSIWSQELENNTTISRYTNQYRSSRSTINRSTRNSRQDFNSLISIPEMIAIVNDIIQNGSYQTYNSQIRKSALDVVISDKQHQRDKAQEKLSINSIKLEYDQKDNDLGFSIGVKVPITKNSYESLLRAQQQRYSNIDAQNIVIEVSEQLQEKQFELLSLQDKWASDQKLLYKFNRRMKRLAGINNIELPLALKKRRLQTLNNQQETYIKALRKYIEIINTAGMLSAKPYRNWLQTGVPQIL